MQQSDSENGWLKRRKVKTQLCNLRRCEKFVYFPELWHIPLKDVLANGTHCSLQRYKN